MEFDKEYFLPHPPQFISKYGTISRTDIDSNDTYEEINEMRTNCNGNTEN